MPDPLNFGCALVAATPSLRTYAASVTTDSEAANALVQKALARGWKDRRNYRSGTDLKAWLRHKAMM